MWTSRLGLECSVEKMLLTGRDKHGWDEGSDARNMQYLIRGSPALGLAVKQGFTLLYLLFLCFPISVVSYASGRCTIYIVGLVYGPKIKKHEKREDLPEFMEVHRFVTRTC